MISAFTRDTRLVVLAIGSILISGFFSFLVIPRMEDPVLTERAALVITRVPGAAGKRVESLVTEQVVRCVREFDEVKEVQSTSRANVSTVVVTLNDNIFDVDEVWARVRDKLSSLRPTLPPDAESPELDIIQVRAYATILGLVWRGEGQPVYSVHKRSADELADRIRSISDTESVELFGKPDEEIVLEVSRTELARMGLTAEDVSRQIAANDSKLPAGLVRSGNREVVLEVGEALDSLASIQRIPIESKSTGQTSYVGDFATIKKGISDPPRSEAIIDGCPGIMISASVLPNARIDNWNRDLQACLRDYRQTLPSDLELIEIFNQTSYVEARISGLIQNLFVSALSVFAVVFFMMGWRSSLIVGTALPLSSCIVFFCLRMLGIPLHQMSLSGLVIALGMLEGTAIIIVDEIQRRIREGEDKYDAVAHGVAHMALPLFGSAATTVLSFLPIAIMPGPSGEFVGTIGTSVILALISSLFLSMTIIPALTAISTPRQQPKDSFITRGYSSKWMSAIYKKSLWWALRSPWLTFVLGIVLAVPGFFAIVYLPLQFFPSADRDQLHLEIELSPQASMAETRQVAARVRSLLLEHPEIATVDWVLGRNAPSFYYNMIGTRTDSPNFAEALIQTRTSQDLVTLVQKLQRELSEKIPQAQVRLLMLEQGPPYVAPIELRILGYNEDSLREYGERLRNLLQSYPEVIQTQADLTDVFPKVVYDVHEAELKLLGLQPATLARQLMSNIEGIVGGSVLEGNVEIPIRVRLSADQRADLSAIENVDLLSDSMGPVRSAISLSSISTPRLKAEPALIARFNNNKVNQVSAYLEAGVLPSTVFASLEKDLRKPENQPPMGCTVEFGGESSKRTEAVDQLLGNISLLAAGTVFVLVFSLKSFRAMFVILGIGVLSFGMAIFCLGVTGYAFGFTAIVGAMGMVGIAINDSIVVLAELRADPECYRGNKEAMVNLLMRATRHVLCTTFTVGCSFVPMLIDGGTFWPPMAMVISGGVFGATWLALYWIPATHLILQPRAHRLAS